MANYTQHFTDELMQRFEIVSIVFLIRPARHAGYLVVKYAAELKSEGIKMLSMALGWVETQEKSCRCSISTP
jgi:hypothetical protein